jgi:hypothetical protein
MTRLSDQALATALADYPSESPQPIGAYSTVWLSALDDPDGLVGLTCRYNLFEPPPGDGLPPILLVAYRLAGQEEEMVSVPIDHAVALSLANDLIDLVKRGAS